MEGIAVRVVLTGSVGHVIGQGFLTNLVHLSQCLSKLRQSNLIFRSPISSPICRGFCTTKRRLTEPFGCEPTKNDAKRTFVMCHELAAYFVTPVTSSTRRIFLTSFKFRVTKSTKQSCKSSRDSLKSNNLVLRSRSSADTPCPLTR